MYEIMHKLAGLFQTQTNNVPSRLLVVRRGEETFDVPFGFLVVVRS